MMKTVAIISEYNPFHNGHLYQIERLREHFGADTAVIAIMSGSFTQRGDVAIMDKWSRAEAAVLCGVNLVLELPFPYSSSSAEFFARGGVHIANAIGAVDVLAFGSESGDVELLERTAGNLSSPLMDEEISRLNSQKEASKLGYAQIRETAYQNAFGQAPHISLPNNILAIEYIKALRALDSAIEPFTIKRIGSPYDNEELSSGNIQSATAIRRLFSENNSACDFIPNNAYKCILEKQDSGAFPHDQEKLFSAVIASLTLNFTDDSDDIHDVGGGLYNRLKKKSLEATSIQSLVELTATKKYTTARIKRSIWYSLLGVTSSDVRAVPEYTQVLAMDKTGQALLKKIKKTSSISVLTRPSDIPQSDIAIKQKALADKADAISQLARPRVESTGSIYKRTPFVKKDV